MSEKVLDLLVVWLQASDEVKISLLALWLVLLFLIVLCGLIIIEILRDERLGKFFHEIIDLYQEFTPNGFWS